MFRAWMFSMLVACGGGDTPSPQDAAPSDTALAPDVPVACAVPGECPCFSNDDCPEGTRCHAATPDSVYCEPGPRGTGQPGEVCTMENDCASALCVEGSDTFRCSRTCTDAAECPPELPRCIAGIGICARAL